jgi:1-deoxy-D-xylulose-5-phosphate reductoisomerase
VLNAANEVAVAAFLRGEIRFTDIPRWVERALTKFSAVKAGSLSDMLEVDQSVRTYLSEPAT